MGESVCNETAFLITGCGILEKEVCLLIEKNGWNIKTEFLDSCHPVGDRSPGKGLSASIRNREEGKAIVLYGHCHPRIDAILREEQVQRIHGLNCIEMLIGEERYREELERGAYFLIEKWAMHFESAISASLGTNRDIIREIFHEDRKYLLGIRTPCSGDFSESVRTASRMVDLPIQWLDTGLENLESLLRTAMDPIQE